MGDLTLLPGAMARPGARFTFLGPNRGEECVDCPYQALCFRLEPGQSYQVERVRKVTHPCNLHDGDQVQVAEVIPAGFTTTVETRRLRGSATTWKPIDCGMPECPNYKLCHPVGPPAGGHYEITKRGETVECPMHYKITQVWLSLRAPP